MIFNTAQNLGAIRIRDIENNHADGVTALAAQGAGKQIGTISQFFRYLPDAGARLWRDALGSGPVIQYHRNGSDREPAFSSNIANGDHQSSFVILSVIPICFAANINLHLPSLPLLGFFRRATLSISG